MHGQDQHRQTRRCHPDVLQQLEAIWAIERYVHHQDVRPRGLNCRQRRVHLFSFATDHQIGLLIDEQSQALAHNRMIVNHEYGFLFGCTIVIDLLSDHRRPCFDPSLPFASGNRHVTVIPPAAPLSTFSDPPIIRAR